MFSSIWSKTSRFGKKLAPEKNPINATTTTNVCKGFDANLLICVLHYQIWLKFTIFDRFTKPKEFYLWP